MRNRLNRLLLHITLLISIPIFAQNYDEENNEVTYEELLSIFETDIANASTDILISSNKSKFLISIYDENNNPATKRKCRNIKTTKTTNKNFIEKLKEENLIQKISLNGYYYPENYNFKNAKRILFVFVGHNYGYHQESYVIALKKPSEINKALNIAKTFYQNEKCFEKLDRRSSR